MLNKYDVYEKLATIGGLTGRVMVWVGMASGCILLWYYVIRFIF
mgnify:CR=1 FL=1|tara:strand:- start:66 stop:197 length:132 start_codon:yes stop_codon:yes gene_type:complete